MCNVQKMTYVCQLKQLKAEGMFDSRLESDTADTYGRPNFDPFPVFIVATDWCVQSPQLLIPMIKIGAHFKLSSKQPSGREYI